MNNMIPVFEAESIIQREAILGHLQSLGFLAHGTERDFSRRYADSSFDYSFEGYSATMGGFNIFVETNLEREAKLAIQNYLKSVSIESGPIRMSSDTDRFYRASLFFMGPFALYYMVKVLINRTPIRHGLFWPSAFFAVFSTAVLSYIGWLELAKLLAK